MTEPIDTIAVIGAGVMGRGIAHLMARGGKQTILYDAAAGMAEKAKMSILAEVDQRIARGKANEAELSACTSNITIVGNLHDLASADLVVEAIIETLEAKTALFRSLETVCSDRCILATNTSSLSVTDIAKVLRKPQRFAGLHFFNPATMMKLVEVVAGPSTESGTTKRLVNLSHDLGRTAVEVRDSPGFLVNRCARPFYGEALKMLEDGVADAATIDACLKLEGGFPLGPFELIDLVGVDIHLNATRAVWNAFGQAPRFTPSPLLEDLVKQGKLGRKTNAGFFAYPREATAPLSKQSCHPDIFLRVASMLANEAAFAFQEGLAPAEGINTALKLGLNFKHGPHDLAKMIGVPAIIDTLERYAKNDSSGRYTICTALAEFADQ
ncbi:MAG: 3-hydroxyacyl-CoA dehydrogenase NAD-binding domain-containing protein [Phyllobacterium sp.]|uniref:3-hydroxyacyl-CoA dehydrogenase NAD-binding domain-containing protein n=1 Tax=Phyllobacterium sp. TaxID=1871046 RepID=UPI0030F32BC1